MLHVGDQVKLLSLEKASRKPTGITIAEDMESYFGNLVTVSYVNPDRHAFNIDDSSFWFSMEWVDSIIKAPNTEHITSTFYFNQHVSFLGETFCINNITFFKDSNNVVHMLPQQLV